MCAICMNSFDLFSNILCELKKFDCLITIFSAKKGFIISLLSSWIHTIAYNCYLVQMNAFQWSFFDLFLSLNMFLDLVNFIILISFDAHTERKVQSFKHCATK